MRGSNVSRQVMMIFSRVSCKSRQMGNGDWQACADAMKLEFLISNKIALKALLRQVQLGRVSLNEIWPFARIEITP